ncbi:MAG: methionyl-tRNA formyltransferase [Bacillota bacterium]|mgnify:CR=1 FL=1|jgi:methionyl-tRNA formyltransferase|nr:methionyl-tRNA formyltransferase [Bacillota bacterium]NLJ02039.1 methionyl-tRNA formyltransferase [Bacillota bacterium]
MRIIFMGTPDFAVPSLEVLVEEHDVVAVVTQPDRRSGRGQRLRPSPVKEAALKHGLTVLQPEKVGVPEVMDELEAYGADLFVVVAFGQKLPDRLLEMPKYGCVNVHSSLLPKYRGAAPINAAIVQGDSVTGVTTMYMDSGWDTGDIILQAEEPILPRDTAGALHDRLMVKGAELLRETVRQIAAGNAPRKPQDHGAASYAFKLSKDDSYVDFKEPADRLDRLIRGMNPWPLAYTYVGEETVKIHEALPSDASGAPGEILALEGQGLLVGCGLGSLLLLKVQRPNAKAVSGVDFANGLRLRVGDYL